MKNKKFDLRFRIYLFAVIFGWMTMLFPYIVHADLFGTEIHDLYAEITSNVEETNDLLKKAFRFSQCSPYTVINQLAIQSEYASISNMAINLRTASKTVALIVAVLLILVDFLRKSINFEWASKWENILLFLVKVIIVKQVIQNADTIVSHIYALFDYINEQINSTTFDFLPYGEVKTYKIKEKQSFVEQWDKGFFEMIGDKISGDVYNIYEYTISEDAVKMFFPDATFPNNLFLDEDNKFANPTTNMVFTSTIEKFLLQPYFLVMKGIAYLIFVIIIGRIFELSIYTIFAPLPIATLASETCNDIGKNFIKNYIATVLQIAVIGCMFIVYTAANNYVLMLFPGTKLLQFVVLISLALGVVKSGAWSKKVCGIG